MRLQFLEGSSLPICVDLDGTLIRGSTFPILWRRYRNEGGSIFPLIRATWADFKEALSSRTDLQSETLPYNVALIEELRVLHGQGHTLILLTGADQRVADAVSLHLGIFHEALGSRGQGHFVGRKKASYLVNRFGPFQFAYIGNSFRDLAVWRYAKSIVAVTKSLFLSLVLRAFKKSHQDCVIFSPLTHVKEVCHGK